MTGKGLEVSAANVWALTQQFYAPMPKGGESPIRHDQPVLIPDDVADWAWQESYRTIQRRFNGIAPSCAGCNVVILCFPFHAVEGYDGIHCKQCAYTDMHRGHNGRCPLSKYCTPGC